MLQMGFTMEVATKALQQVDSRGGQGADDGSNMTRIERAIEIAFSEQDQAEQEQKRNEDLLSRDMRGWLLKADLGGVKFVRKFKRNICSPTLGMTSLGMSF